MLVDSHCHLDMLDLEKYLLKAVLDPAVKPRDDGVKSIIPENGEAKNTVIPENAESVYPGSRNYYNAIDAVVENARKNDVTHMLCVSVTLNDFPNLLDIAKRYDNVDASVGLHPNEETDEEPTVEKLVGLAGDDKIVAIGETGLDYFRTEPEGQNNQKERFRTHIRAAHEAKKPLIIHTRQAPKDTITIMNEERAKDVCGVMHCFTESWDMAKKALDLGFYISFSGIVTFKNATDLQEVAKKVPLENMLVETDAPFLAPVPFRGKPNEPAYVRHVAEYIATLKGLSFDVVARQTSENYFRLFAQ